MIKNKKGIALNQAFGAILSLVVVAVLVIIGIILFVNLGATFTDLAVATTTAENIGIVNSVSAATTANATLCNFEDYVVSSVTNASAGGEIIPAGNYTVDSVAGTIIWIEDENNSGGYNGTEWFVNSTANWGGESCVASQAMITQFGTYPTLIGLIGTIIFLGLVIGVLVSSFVFGGRGGGI